MRNINKNKVMILGIALGMASFLLQFTSCQKDEIFENTISEKIEPEFGVYPMAKGTRSENEGFWESWNTVTLTDGKKVSTPWNTKYTHSVYNADILEDVKYEDGWDLIFYVLGGQDEKDEAASPYLVFHNRYTGILKVFYYLFDTAHHPNNHGIWELHTEESLSLFAFQDNIISMKPDNKTYNISNLAENNTGGFYPGWNCCQIELAYDPNQSGNLIISTRSSNEVKLNFTGNLEAETSGLMEISTGQNNFASGIAKIAGKGAENWVLKKLNDKTLLGIPSSYWGNAVNALVSGGAAKIIGAMTGLFKSDNSTKSLQLTTNGTFTMDGTATFESTTGIYPLKLNIDPEMVGYLGVWNLQEEPTLLFSPYATLKTPQECTNGYTREFRANIVNNYSTKASIIINPTINQYIKSKSITTDYYESSKYTTYKSWGNYGAWARVPDYNDKVYDDTYKPNYYMIVDVPFIGEDNEYMSIDQFQAPMEVFIPDVPNGPKGARSNLRYNSRFLASVGVHLTLPNGSEAHSYHRCLPKIDWNYSEYDNEFYWYLYPCEPVTRNNNYYGITSIKEVDEDRLKLEQSNKITK